MEYPPLVRYDSAVKYRQHFENIYCRKPIPTFDGIQVRFRKRDFNHCFFDSIKSKDDTFSQLRAERIDWIKATLEDPSSDLHVGWDKKKKRYDSRRRVAIVMNNYVVVIAMKKSLKADFCTAFLADTEPLKGQNFSTLELIKMCPKWK
jgi:hypothetical protein